MIFSHLNHFGLNSDHIYLWLSKIRFTLSFCANLCYVDPMLFYACIYMCVCVDICMFIQQDCEILITVNSSSVHLLLWKYLFHVHTPFKNCKLFWGSCHQLLHRCLVQCLEHAGQVLNKWVKLECLYIIFFFLGGLLQFLVGI